MTLPSAVFGLLIALLVGALFHLIVDGGPGRLFLYMLLSTAGFGAGQWLASSQHWIALPVGPLQIGPAMTGSILVLLVGHWLSRVNVQVAGHDDKV